jgi:hypothetical protein
MGSFGGSGGGGGVWHHRGSAAPAARGRRRGRHPVWRRIFRIGRAHRHQFTFTTNTAGRRRRSVSGCGCGAIFNHNGTLTILSTLSGSTYPGRPRHPTSATALPRRTMLSIIWDSTGSGFVGNISSGTNDTSENTISAPSGFAGSFDDHDPLLSTLADNGGPTQTMAIGTTSPAINNGHSAGAPTTDQRGFGRVGAVDIGVRVQNQQHRHRHQQQQCGGERGQRHGGRRFSDRPRPGDSPLRLVSGYGDNSLFAIDGGNLKTAASWNVVCTPFASRVPTPRTVQSEGFHDRHRRQRARSSTPGPQTAFGCGPAICGISVGDPEGGALSVTLASAQHSV